MTIRVAIVDDHRMIREALADLLAAKPGIDVVGTAGDAAEAMRIVDHGAPEVVLLDLALPDVHGLDLLDRLRISHPEVRFLILSMHSEPEYAAEGRRRGAAGLIAKAAPIEALLDAIRTVAVGGTIPVEERLTAREHDVLARIGRGDDNDRIAAELGIQTKTVEAHLQHLMAKLGVDTRAGLIGHARRLGL